jgi:hypothetical protein
MHIEHGGYASIHDGLTGENRLAPLFPFANRVAGMFWKIMRKSHC